MIFINSEKSWAHTWCKRFIEITSALDAAATLFSETSVFAIWQNTA